MVGRDGLADGLMDGWMDKLAFIDHLYGFACKNWPLETIYIVLLFVV